MKAAKTTKPAAGRAAGAQSVKAMLLAIGEAEDKFSDLSDEIPPPALTAPIIEAHVTAANSSGVAGFRGGFYEALAEWLAPTVGCGTICHARNWSPPAAVAEAPSVAAPAPERTESAAESLHDKLFGILTGSEADGALDKALHLVELADWIESARGVTEAVRREADFHGELEAALRKRGIRFAAAVWEDGHSEGLRYLQMSIRAEIVAAREAMQDALAASREAEQ